jgi:hypothetical protein
MQDFWPSCGFAQLQLDARGWLQPTDDYLRLFLDRPELALVPESCRDERRLHAALHRQPARAVPPAELAALRDDDARQSYGYFLKFRDALLAAGTLEAAYLALFRQGVRDTPPLFLDLLAQAILRNVLSQSADAYELRAAELLFRPQRILLEQGQILAGDLTTLDMLNETGGLGDIGRLLAQAGAPLREVQIQVLNDANAPDYWQAGERHSFLLDLTHEVQNDLSHGLVLTMTRARSGLKALASVLQKWVQHLLGVEVRIKPVQKIEDPAWRWHLGLDIESSALLNDLYEDRPVAPERMQRLLSLFRLDFAERQDMRADVAGKPVYLGLMMNSQQTLKLKPQNLLLNLPLARIT